MAKSNQLDVTSGPLFRKFIAFAVPILLSNLLQMFYNSADLIVVGRFAQDGAGALAAVGSTSSLYHLFVNLFIGFSVGTSVAVSHAFGAKNHKDIQKSVETSALLSLICGFGVAIIGAMLARNSLIWMKTDLEVIDQATVYLRIIFIGAPTLICYNFGAAILRALGDSKRPLMILIISGLLNILLNLFLVIVWHMDVAGVALATVFSQLISAVWVWVLIFKEKDIFQLKWNSIHIYKDSLGKILKIGLPAGIQSCLFSISNVILQSSINALGKIVMAGNSACLNLESYPDQFVSSIATATLTFTGQNMGAKKYRRVKRILWMSMATITVTTVIIAAIFLFFRNPLFRIYSTDTQVIYFAEIRLITLYSCHIISAYMSVLANHVRGMGYSFITMFSCVFGVCVLRIIYILWVYPHIPYANLPFFQGLAAKQYFFLMLIYPISWLAVDIFHIFIEIFLFKKMKRLEKAESFPE